MPRERIGSRTASHVLCIVLLGVVTLLAACADAQTPPSADQTRVIGGVRYATLDTTNPDASSTGTQEQALRLPSGWSLVPNAAAGVSAAASAAWGTDCLVLADGSLTPTSSGVACASFMVVDARGFVRPLSKRVFIQQNVGPGPSTATVQPSSGALTGGTLVTISGSNLGDGSDITSVTIGGSPAQIQSQTADQVVVITGPAPASGPADIVIQSTSRGRLTLQALFTYGAVSNMLSVSPARGALAGGYLVTITGAAALGSGDDVQQVTIGGVAAQIVSQTASQVVVRVPRGTQPGEVAVAVTSASRGVTSAPSAFSYINAPLITTVTPSSGSTAGGVLVTISGQLGSGSDITSVTLNGVAAEIVSQTATSVVVRAAAGSVGTGAVVVVSASLGTATLANGFTYVGGISITSVQPSSAASTGGTRVTIFGAGLSDNNDVLGVTLANVSALVQSQTANSVVVVVAPGSPRTGDVVVRTGRGIATLPNAFTYEAAGAIRAVQPARGPATGNAIVTILGTAMGNGTDITSVSLTGSEATILSQSSDMVVVQTNPGPVATGNVVVRSASKGTLVLNAAYTYLAGGQISSVVPSSGSSASTLVTITGTDLGNGTDVLRVLLANVPATIQSQSATQVVVRPGVSGAGAGHVMVQSQSRGIALSLNAWTYTVGNNDAPFLTPAFGPLTGNPRVVLTVPGLASSADISQVTLGTVTATVLPQSTPPAISVPATTQARTADVVIVPSAAGSASVTITNGYTFLEAPMLRSVRPALGLTGSQNTVTLSGTWLGSGNDITRVAFGATNATIVSQTVESVVVQVGPAPGGRVDVTVESTSRGIARLPNAFFFNDTAAPLPHITFQRRTYATIDAAQPADTGFQGCTDRFTALPQGWIIAPNNDETRLAVMGGSYRFGTLCLVLADGTGISPVDTSPCGTGLLSQVGNTYSAARCPGRILLMKPAGQEEPDTWNSSPAITNWVPTQGRAYATIDNVAATQQEYGCTGVATRVPDGWTVAPNDAVSVALVRQYVWGTACLVLANGVGIGHDGQPCVNGQSQLLSLAGHVAVATCNMRVLITRNLPVPLPPAPPRSLRLKMLIVSTTGDEATDSQLSVATRACRMFSMPCDVWAASPGAGALPGTLSGPLPTLLSTASNVGNYHAIVVTQLLLLTSNATVYAQLDAYCEAFRVNKVVLSSYPIPALGVEQNTTAPVGATPATVIVTPGFRNDASLSGINVNHRVSIAGIFRYPVLITDPSIATSVLTFVNDANVTEGAAAVIVNKYKGHRELHFFMAQGSWAFVSTLYTQMWVQWVTNGLYVGERRMVWVPQVDDLFLSTALFDPATNRTGTFRYRIGPAELQFHRDFLQQLNQNLPNGSRVTLEFAFNGLGVPSNPQTDPLYNLFMQLMPNFWFVTHGYTHLNLTGQSHDAVTTEFRLNYDFQNRWLITEPARAEYNSNQSAITPAITGLFTGDALRALWDLGVRDVAGDNSRPELRVLDNPYACQRTSQAVNGFAGMLVVPRFPTAVLFDVSLPEEATAEYGLQYDAFWGRRLTLDEIMALEATRTVNNLMNFRPDMYMFHQANMRTFTWRDPVTGANTTHSLLSLWLRYVQQELVKYNALPVLNFKQETVAQRCVARMARMACQYDAMAAINASGQLTSVSLSASPSGTPCEVLITGANFNAPGVTMETYGPDVTAHTLTPASGQAQLPLTTPLTWNV